MIIMLLFSYEIAPEQGLILSECGFENVKWENPLYSDIETYQIVKVIQIAHNNKILI